MFPLLQDLGKNVICSDRGALLCPCSPCSKTLVEMLFAVIEVLCCVNVPPLQNLGRYVICSDRGALLCQCSPCYKTLVEMLFAVIEVHCCVNVPPATRPW